MRNTATTLKGYCWAPPRLLLLLLGGLAMPTAVQAQAAPAASGAEGSCPRLWQRSFPRLQDEQPQPLCQYAGQVVLVVNTASYCGFTPQYKGLEAIYRRYKSRGFVVLGFPANDFGEQEPGANNAIAEFCANTFDVKFPMFAKSVVRVDKADSNPLFVELARATDSKPRWNFHKYLIDRSGKPVEAFGSMTAPDGPALTQAIERLL